MPRTLAMILVAAATVAGAKAPPTVVTPAGPPERCVPIAQIDHTVVRDDRTIDFIMRGKTSYRNVLPNSCPELGFEQAFSYETSLSELCSVDIITVFRNTGGGGPRRGASCGLGQFQPVTGLK